MNDIFYDSYDEDGEKYRSTEEDDRDREYYE